MAKIAILADTHFGLKNDSPIVLNYFSTFFREVFFPAIDERGIRTVIHLGDLVDRRKSIGFLTAKTMREQYIEESSIRGLTTHIIVGNHDGFYKNTNEVNALGELLRDQNFKVYADPAEFKIGSTTFAAVPWVTMDNERAVREFVDKTTASIMVAHLELPGFEMDSGQVCSTDVNAFIVPSLAKFDMVLSGHFHHKSERGNVKYLGSPYDMNISDTWVTKGFHILDTTTNTLEFIPNHEKLFYQLMYDGTTDLDQNLSHLQDKYVRLVINEKNDLFRYERFFHRVERSNPAALKVVDRTELQFTGELGTANTSVMDTQTIINGYVDALASTSVDKELLKRYIADLYAKAQLVVD